jgi:hypothetical protein
MTPPRSFTYLRGIKTSELDVCKTQGVVILFLHDNFAAAFEIYSTFIKHIKAENPQLNVSEVGFARGKVGKNSFGKHNSTGSSNVSNDAVGDRFFEKHEYHALTPDQNNKLSLKRHKRGNVVKSHTGHGHTGNGNSNGKTIGKGPTIKYLANSIAALITKIDKFSLPDDDDDDEKEEYSDEEEGTSNHFNTALTRQSKKKKRGNAPGI